MRFWLFISLNYLRYQRPQPEDEHQGADYDVKKCTSEHRLVFGSEIITLQRGVASEYLSTQIFLDVVHCGQNTRSTRRDALLAAQNFSPSARANHPLLTLRSQCSICSHPLVDHTFIVTNAHKYLTRRLVEPYTLLLLRTLLLLLLPWAMPRYFDLLRLHHHLT